MKRCVLLIALVGVLSGCSVTNKSLRTNYSSYNETIHYNQNQQMLLNLVRLKYRQLPMFLKIGALSASYVFEVRGGADFGSGGSNKVYGLDLGGSYSTRPTITYTPLEGDTFVKQVLSEVDPDAFALLFRSGWPIRTLCHVMAERLGETVNNTDDPSYADFIKLVDRLQESQDNRKLEFKTEDGKTTVVWTTDLVNPLVDERLPEERDLEFSINSVQLRSFLDIMFFLGKNTTVPKPHENQVRNSRPNGWINIASNANRPDDSMVSVKHNGYWFSIASDDIPSKDTFALVSLLYQMQAGDIPTVQPLLTLPIAQP